ncbi:MAG: Cyclomaltodextrinase [Pseudomonadota bacterium]|jgi:glycosidase
MRNVQPSQMAAYLLAFTAITAQATPLQPDAKVFAAREKDWRNGAIVYQILVDRFVPSANLAAKKHLYPAPKVLREWHEQPLRGVELEDQKLNSQELEFWGGDIQSAQSRLDHVKDLGATAIYLNPIHLAWTNHKYDAFDYKAISPEYGNRDDFKRFAAQAHQLGLKVVLDGVFNHMGRNSPQFKDAMANPQSPWRNWFVIGSAYKGGARVWTGFQNLPELNLDNPAVRKYLYEAPDSVVRGYLRDGADGWRLDTAYELGLPYMRALTKAAHQEKKDALVVGEIVNYPDQWLTAMDGVMNFTLRQIILSVAQGEINPAVATRMTERLVLDTGIEPLLKSWNVIDNHDIPRIATQVPEAKQRRLVQTLQFTLPGSPNVYYGSELGMTGGGDPENRNPMRWDWVSAQHPEMVWMKKLISLHQHNRALRVGNFRRIETDRLFAFERYTDKTLETRLVLANPGKTEITERILVTNAGLMDDTPLVDLMGADPHQHVATMGPGLISVTVPAQTVMVLKPVERDLGGYSRYKRYP